MIHILIDTENINSFEAVFIIRSIRDLKKFKFDRMQIKPFFNEKHLDFRKANNYIDRIVSCFEYSEVYPYYMWDVSHNALDRDIKKEVKTIISYDKEPQIYIVSNDKGFLSIKHENFMLFSKVLPSSNLLFYRQEKINKIYTRKNHSFIDVYDLCEHANYEIEYVNLRMPNFKSEEHKENFKRNVINKFITNNLKKLYLSEIGFKSLQYHLKEVYRNSSYLREEKRKTILNEVKELKRHRVFIQELEEILDSIRESNFPHKLFEEATTSA